MGLAQSIHYRHNIAPRIHLCTLCVQLCIHDLLLHRCNAVIAYIGGGGISVNVAFNDKIIMP